MKSNISKRDFSTFNLLDVRKYLKDENWNIIGQSSKAILFEGLPTDSGKPITFKLPASKENTDYFERISDLINILAEIKKTQHHKIINKISSMNTICPTKAGEQEE